MAMSKRLFRTKQAIQAFNDCRKCSTLPANKIREVDTELVKAHQRLEQQEAEVSILQKVVLDSIIIACSLVAATRFEQMRTIVKSGFQDLVLFYESIL
jgi:hypothetical protein